MKNKRNGKTVIAYCACGCGGWWSICSAAHYEQDASTRRDYAGYIAEGATVETISDQDVPFDLHGCQKDRQQVQAVEQLKLF